MAELKLDILVLNTYTSKVLGIADISTYPVTPVVNPTIEITVPGFDTKVVLPFTINSFNTFTSEDLEITSSGEATLPLPDGIYILKYSVTPAYENYVEKTILRVDQLMEKYNSAFLTLDMMECDQAIKTQDKVALSTIYFHIQGAIAAANNCAITTSNKLYMQAGRLLDNFMNKGCACSGNNYVTNFTKYY